MSTIITLYGLPGSGKSTLAKQLQQELGGHQHCYLREEPISGLTYMDNVGRTIQTRMIALDNRVLGYRPQFILRDMDINTSIAIHGYSLDKDPARVPDAASILVFVNPPRHILAEQIAKRGRPAHLEEVRYLGDECLARAYMVYDRYPQRGYLPLIYTYRGCHQRTPKEITEIITKFANIRHKYGKNF